MRFAKKVIYRFVKKQREKYNLNETDHALVKWDIYYTHIDVGVLQWLLSKNIHVVIVPANYTDDLQEMDVAINKPFKTQLAHGFVNWRAGVACDQLNAGVTPEQVFVDYGLKAIKHLHVQWVKSAWKYCIDNGFIKKAFKKVDNAFVHYI